VGDAVKISPNPGEVRTYKWVKIEDLKKYLLFESQLDDTLQMIDEILKS
jgi:isopentenyldiphosphate isomerase